MPFERFAKAQERPTACSKKAALILAAWSRNGDRLVTDAETASCRPLDLKLRWDEMRAWREPPPCAQREELTVWANS